jgi:hypothetical protein
MFYCFFLINPQKTRKEPYALNKFRNIFAGKSGMQIFFALNPKREAKKIVEISFIVGNKEPLIHKRVAFNLWHQNPHHTQG